MQPEVNASWADEAITQHGRIDVGVAVALDEGLITPVVRYADSKAIWEIGDEVRDLAGRAKRAANDRSECGLRFQTSVRNVHLPRNAPRRSRFCPRSCRGPSGAIFEKCHSCFPMWNRVTLRQLKIRKVL